MNSGADMTELKKYKRVIKRLISWECLLSTWCLPLGHYFVGKAASSLLPPSVIISVRATKQLQIYN